MPFLSGRLTCMRFKVTGRGPRSFGPDHVDKLAAHAIGKQRVVSAEGTQVGWIAGDHILDTKFDLAKNIVNDALHFALRIDAQAVPADLYRAYFQVELEGLASQNPSGHPSARQKREARYLAKERLEQEAKDGRYLRRKAVPVLWDAPSGELLVGSTAVTALDYLHTHYRQTFHHGFELLGAGRQAFLLAEATQKTRSVDDAVPTAFVPSHAHEIAWTPDEANRDFLGNEFLLWLWFYLENEADTVTLSDGSEATVMLTRTLTLECPRGQTGKETISSEAPARLPEAHRALQAGKLPRKAGLTVVRQDHTYDFTLHAETLAITGAKMPVPEGEEERARLEERITNIRHLLETVDLLYAAFCERRLSPDWTKETARMKKWLKSGE
ncbi:MAG: hypothetical protein L0Y72_29805 [Gemmataceae bacterium]|nr:hypothetical protein [Gemmataceae bacterium]MCI0743243.1 hypothetical protein [Gemmataceae bacterium]